MFSKRSQQVRSPSGGGPAQPQGTVLDAEAWPGFFDGLAGSSEGVLGTVEVLRRGAQKAPSGVLRPLQQIGYRVPENVLELTLGSPEDSGKVRYFIASPHRIQLVYEVGTIELLVDGADGTRTVICLFNAHAPVRRAASSNDATRGSSRAATAGSTREC